MRTWCSLAILTIAWPLAGSNAQLVLTDEFDFWEDQVTHSVTTSGITFQGAYTCGNDKTLRCGNCSQGTGAASVVMKVNPNCDTVLLAFMLGWAGGNSVVTVDGAWAGLLNIFGSCTWDSLMLVNTSAFTADSAITVIIRDTILGCSGDIQVARLRVYSSGALSTGLSPAIPDDGREVSIAPNPSSGPFTMYAQGIDMKNGRIVITDSHGRVVYSHALHKIPGNNLVVDPGNLRGGVYWISIQTSEGIISRRIARH